MEEHAQLFSEASLKLGWIHWYLLRADREMEERCHEAKTNSHGFRDLTEFGHSVGKDEMYWWVYQKEANVQELAEQVKAALPAAQVLKEKTAKLERLEFRTYGQILTKLRDFAEEEEEAIDKVLRFAAWLFQRDSLAPVVMFNYRVWGSTRMAERSIDIEIEPPERVSQATIQVLTLIVCGLFFARAWTKSSVAMEISYEKAEARNFEGSSPVDISEDEVDVRVSRLAFREFAVYFEQIRDSLRELQLETDKYNAEKDLLRSETFWRDFIDKARRGNRVESALWDFKESLAMWHASDAIAKSKAQIDFCRLVASFANRDGGAIIVGVGDKSRTIEGVPNLEQRMRSINDAIYRNIEYANKDHLIHLQQVPFNIGVQPSRACVVIAVAQAGGVVAVKGEDNVYYYPDRAETGVRNAKQEEIEARKGHLKDGDNFGFMKHLRDFLYD